MSVRGRRRGLSGLQLRHGYAARPGAGRAPSRWRSGTSRPDLQGVSAVVLPGGFAYGDYIRAGVIARFSPVMRAVSAFAADGGPGPGHLQRLPGPRGGRPRAGRAAAQPLAAVRRPLDLDRRGARRHAVHARHGRRRAAADAGRARRGLLLRRRRDARRAGARRPGPVPVRRRGRARAADPRTRRTRTARCARSPG